MQFIPGEWADNGECAMLPSTGSGTRNQMLTGSRRMNWICCLSSILFLSKTGLRSSSTYSFWPLWQPVSAFLDCLWTTPL